MKRAISKYDHALSAWLHERPRSLRYFYGWITLIGHPAVVIFIAGLCIIAGFGLSLPAVSYGFIATVLAYSVSVGLKLILRRPRPATPYAAGMLQTSFSFPSGHAFGSLIVYGLLAYFSIRYLELFWALLAVSGLWILIFFIGISRIYLGAHFVLDVLGGWLLSGIALLWIINTVAR